MCVDHSTHSLALLTSTYHCTPPLRGTSVISHPWLNLRFALLLRSNMEHSYLAFVGTARRHVRRNITVVAADTVYLLEAASRETSSYDLFSLEFVALLLHLFFVLPPFYHLPVLHALKMRYIHWASSK